ncbi:MAG: 30S ribosome-binding factor RbfA [Phycisphaeraceae bacterium]|nr:30S ribosome-binding factor RbfA [Phycisphaeraceae bacterium]MCW5753250.1 30S ribosome-binding factor RbfA [Phycisphaeraceae bacterium]
MNRRTQQVAATIRRAVQEVLSRGLSDPRVRGLITVTGITMSDDLRTATLDVSIYPPEHQELSMHGLKAAAAHIRHQAGELVDLKRMPTIQFRLDTSLKREAAVLEALAKVREEQASQAADAQPPEDES